MRSVRYLNTVLTVLCVLVAVQIWTSWSTSGLPVASTAQAQPASPPSGGGIPDAGAQRKEMIDLLKRLAQQHDDLGQLLRSGQVRVKVESGARDGK
ncbi:MAG: hypothetical protein NTW19_18845 [Planctomycetota bacterium]|nr:hypothetical protein [Planctomycetota bacterium]